MTQRAELSGTQLITYQQQWDIDNRLVVVRNTNTNQVTQYFYDADGTRVKRVTPQATMFYVNEDKRRGRVERVFAEKPHREMGHIDVRCVPRPEIYNR